MNDTARGILALAGALVIFLIPLGTRKVFSQLGSAGDFTRLAVFALDLGAAALVAWWLWVRRRLAPVQLPLVSAVVFLAVALLAAFASPVRVVALAHWVRLGLMVVLALALMQIGANSRRWLVVVAGVLVVAGMVQAAIATGQVALQHDFGLRILGESRLAPDIPGVAKLDLAGGKFIRGYGTFPHPNILAAFLAAALVAWWWLFVRRLWSRLWQDIALFGIGLVLVAGLAVTFSRLGLVAAVAAFAFLTVRVWAVPGLRRRFWPNARLVVLLLMGSAIGLGLLLPAWFGRLAVQPNEQAVTLRLEYFKVARRMIADRPWLGVGPGAFAEVLPKYSAQLVELRRGELTEPLVVSPSTSLGINPVEPLVVSGAEPWQRQPVHSVPVLVLAELGVIGGAALALFLWRLLKPLFVRAETTDAALVKALSISWLVVLGVSALGDHFLWAVPQGQILLWVMLAVVAVGARSAVRIAQQQSRWYGYVDPVLVVQLDTCLPAGNAPNQSSLRSSIIPKLSTRAPSATVALRHRGAPLGCRRQSSLK